MKFWMQRFENSLVQTVLARALHITYSTVWSLLYMHRYIRPCIVVSTSVSRTKERNRICSGLARYYYTLSHLKYPVGRFDGSQFLSTPYELKDEVHISNTRLLGHRCTCADTLDLVLQHQLVYHRAPFRIVVFLWLRTHCFKYINI